MWSITPSLYDSVSTTLLILYNTHVYLARSPWKTACTYCFFHRLLIGWFVWCVHVWSITPSVASLPLCQVFENDFPKLVHVFSGLLSQVDKLHTETDQHSKPSSSFLYSQSGTQPENESSNHRQQALMKALGQFEKVYISRLFGRLSESVTQLFSSNSLPREDELVSFVRLLGRFVTCVRVCTTYP